MAVANCPFINPVKPLFSCHSNLTHCTINAHITTISVTLTSAINVETIHRITIQLLDTRSAICINDVSPLSRCLCRYSMGFIGERASNDSGVIENMDFHGFRRYVFGSFGNQAKAIIQQYLVFCRLSTDRKYLTFNDSEWLECPFYIIFSQCDLLSSIICYLFTVDCV